MFQFPTKSELRASAPSWEPKPRTELLENENIKKESENENDAKQNAVETDIKQKVVFMEHGYVCRSFVLFLGLFVFFFLILLVFLCIANMRRMCTSNCRAKSNI